MIRPPLRGHPRLALLIGAAFAAPAFAQAPAPPPSMPKPACTKPDEFPGRLATDRARRAWDNEAKAYGDCVRKFVEDQRAISELAIKAANTAIEEYNAMMKAARAEMEQ